MESGGSHAREAGSPSSRCAARPRIRRQPQTPRLQRERAPRELTMSEMSWCRLAPVLPRVRHESGPEPRVLLRAHDLGHPVTSPIRPNGLAVLSRAKVGTGRCPSRLRPRPRTPHHARRSMHVRADTIGIDPCGASTLRPRTILAHLRRHGRQHHHPQPDVWAPVGAIPQRAFLVCADSLDPEIFVCALGGVCGREDHPERAHVRRLRRAQCHLFCRRVFASSRQPSVARHLDRPAPDIRRCESTTPTRKVITTSWARSADSGVLCDSTSRKAR